MLADAPSTEERAVETGTRGSGGDRTLEIDQGAERLVLAELDALREDGFRFTALSEEKGEIDYGDPGVRVIIDPIDGSLNAKRGIPHHALSVAVADGETMADVAFAYVYDFGPSEEWWARRGEGAYLNGTQIDPGLKERRGRDGRLEVLGIESADPRWVSPRSTRSRIRPTGCAPWVRSRSRSARSRAPGSTASSRSVAPAASTPLPGN